MSDMESKGETINKQVAPATAEKSVLEIPSSLWLELVRALELSPTNDWEQVARYYSNVFTESDLARIKRNLANAPDSSPSEAVLSQLGNHLVSVDSLHKCFRHLGLLMASRLLSEAFPEKHLASSSSNNSDL